MGEEPPGSPAGTSPDECSPWLPGWAAAQCPLSQARGKLPTQAVHGPSALGRGFLGAQTAPSAQVKPTFSVHNANGLTPAPAPGKTPSGYRLRGLSPFPAQCHASHAAASGASLSAAVQLLSWQPQAQRSPITLTRYQGENSPPPHPQTPHPLCKRPGQALGALGNTSRCRGTQSREGARLPGVGKWRRAAFRAGAKAWGVRGAGRCRAGGAGALSTSSMEGRGEGQHVEPAGDSPEVVSPLHFGPEPAQPCDGEETMLGIFQLRISNLFQREKMILFYRQVD